MDISTAMLTAVQAVLLIEQMSPMSNSTLSAETNQTAPSRTKAESRAPSMMESRLTFTNETCYRLTTFDHRAFKLSQTGRVVVDGGTTRNDETVTDFVMMSLDPYTYTIMQSVEEDIIFIWRIISPAFTGNESYYYLSATCGEQLQAKMMHANGSIPIDGHFMRTGDPDDSTFRYRVYGQPDCFVSARNSGFVQATRYSDIPTSMIRSKFPVYNSYTDLMLQTADCHQ